MANVFPNTHTPKINNIILAKEEKSLAEIGRTFATITAKPVTPPKEKLFGNLKK